MSKLKQVIFNGTTIPILDENAAHLPDDIEIQDGDVMVYNEESEGFIYVNKNSLVDIERGVVKNSNKLVRSGDVYNAIAAINNPEGYAVLEVSYDPNTSKIFFNVAQDSPNELLCNVKLFVLSVNINYNTQEQSLNLSNIISILNLTPQSTSTELQIPVYNKDRLLYFLLINNEQDVQTCCLNTDSILIPGVNEKINVGISVSLGSMVGGQTLNVLSSVPVNVDIDVNLTFVNGNERTYQTIKLLAGSSSKTETIFMTGYTRTCYIEIVPSSVDPIKNYVLQTTQLEIPAGLNTSIINVAPSDEHPDVIFTGYTPPRNNIDIKLILPRTNYPALIIDGIIEAGSTRTVISYAGQAFTGPNIAISTGATVSDGYSQYIINPTNRDISLIIKPDGTPY